MSRLNNKGGGTTTTKSRRGNDDNNKHGKNSNNMILKMKLAFILLLIIQVITIITFKSSSTSTSTSTAVVCGQGLQSYSSSELESLSFNSPPRTRSSSSSSSSSSNSDYDYDDYELARTQSFGFFDDIPSKQWKILQNIHYESFPNYYTKSTTSDTKVNPHYNDPIILQQYSNTMNDKRNTKNQLKYSNWWNGENFQIEFHCPMMRRVPPTSQADGPKWVCDLHRLIDNNDNNDNGSCLIYSFGSNGKSEFEQGIKDVTKDSCEIHTFDMETYNKRNGHFNESLKGIATFHSWGLGTVEQSNRNPQTYKTLQQTMDVLGHTNRTIDIFKIDCEWCEWTTYTQWIDTTVVDIRQILVETHNAPLPNARDFFFQLHDTGYVIYSKEANYQNAGGGVEFGFLKLHTDFFLNNTMYNYQL